MMTTTSPANSTTAACELCDRPVPDNGAMCFTCGDKLTNSLTLIADRWPELERVIARLTIRGTGRNGSRSTETPLPINEAASNVGFMIRSTLEALAAVIAKQRGQRFQPDLTPKVGITCQQVIHYAHGHPHLDAPHHKPGSWGDCGHQRCRAIRDLTIEPETAQLARWLTHHVQWVRHAHLDHDDIAGGIHLAAREIKTTTDLPAPLRDLGPCACGTELRTRPGQQQVTCRHCADTYDVAAIDRHAINLARDQLATATEIARFVHERADSDPDTDRINTKPLKAERIRKWKERGRLAVRGHNPAGHPLYRVGDVLDLLNQEHTAPVKGQRHANTECA